VSLSIDRPGNGATERNGHNLGVSAAHEPVEFVRAHTRLAPVPFVPELVLHQADEPIALWEETEAGGVQQPPPFWAFAWAGGQALARHVLDAAQVNAEANAVSLRLVEGDLLQTEDRYAVILAGDVFYSREMSGQVLPYLRRAASHGSLVLVGDPGRAYLPTDGMIKRASYDIEVIEALESVSIRHTTVWQIR
jgi:predicted nicotinamide N-methyase